MRSIGDEAVEVTLKEDAGIEMTALGATMSQHLLMDVV